MGVVKLVKNRIVYRNVTVESVINFLLNKSYLKMLSLPFP